MRDIKTFSGKVDRIANPYMAYMQITCLEMEKARKDKERTSALGRVHNITTRMREIEIEKASLLRALSAGGAVPAPGVVDTGGAPAPGDRRDRGFTLRY
jgi:hypothetical protein